MAEHERDRDRDEQPVFKVVDRRRFTSDGDIRTDAPADVPRPAPAPLLQGGGPDKRAAAAGKPGRPNPHGAPAPAVERGPEFINFLASLATNAMAAMGALPEAQARGMPVNPEMAREYIDIIAMLQDRTQGNLSNEEAAALTRLLAELRMQYVEATGGM